MRPKRGSAALWSLLVMVRVVVGKWVVLLLDDSLHSTLIAALRLKLLLFTLPSTEISDEVRMMGVW